MTLPVHVPFPPAHPSGGLLGRILQDPGATVGQLPAALGDFLAREAWWAAPAAAAATALATAGRLAWHHHRQHRLTAGGTRTTILLPPQVAPASAAALWSHLAGLHRPWYRRLLHGQPHLAFEYEFTDQGLAVHLGSPPAVPVMLIARAVEAAWPAAHTRTRPATTVPLAKGQTVSTGGSLRLARPEALPLRTDHGSDPLRPLLGAGLALAPGEQVLVQILARPATGRRLRRAKRHLHRLRTGTAGPSRTGAVLDVLTHQHSRSLPGSRDPEQQAELRAALAKTAGPQWDTVVRYLVTVPASGDGGRARRQEAHARARGRAHAVASAFAVHAGRNWYARHRLPYAAVQVSRRHFPLRGDLLSVPELAAVAHLPLDPDAPGVQRAAARAVAPTAAITRPGPGTRPLGRATAGPERQVALPVADGRHHLHVMGATGSGKSTLIANLVLADAGAGRGALVVDPKGDLVLDILARLPASAVGRTVLLDPGDRAKPPRLNVLQTDGSDTDVVVDNLVGIFRRIFSAFWGPRTDDVMRAACLTLIRAQRGRQPVTLAEIPEILTNPTVRHRYVQRLPDHEKTLRGFWTWYENLSEASKAAATGPLMNKLRAFLLRSFVTDTIASGDSTFRLDHVLDGGIALVRLPKGVLGEETSRLLGSFVVAKTWQAAARRAGSGEHLRRDCSLYLDEAHNFLNLPYPLEDMLAEARGYRLSLTLAHQHLAQLPAVLREGISANARNKIYFNASPEDARQLERHTAPRLTAHDLSHLGAFHAAARLVTHHADQPAFTLATQPLPAAVPGRATEIRTSSRSTFGPPPTTDPGDKE